MVLREKMFQQVLKGVRNPRSVAGYLLGKVRSLTDKLRSHVDESVSLWGGNKGIKDYVLLVTKAAADYRVFSAFKSDPSYREMLEHVTQELGQKYLAIIKDQSPEFLDQFDQFKINDLVGTPITHFYSGIGMISPTTLRYVKVASDLRKYFGFDIGKKIVEIGVGYGGQLLINDQIFKMKEYHLYDLQPVLSLVQRYLESHILNCAYKTSTLNQNSGDEHYDLAISNYAFSELSSQLQRKYIDKILANSSKGYLTMNSGRKGSSFTLDKLSLDDLRRKLPPFEIFEEHPLTWQENYIIVWGHK
jgi:putative sugar O-methyltransferase